jgi:hypothetical protein
MISALTEAPMMTDAAKLAAINVFLIRIIFSGFFSSPGRNPSLPSSNVTPFYESIVGGSSVFFKIFSTKF